MGLMKEIERAEVIGAKIIEIGHSNYTEPEPHCNGGAQGAYRAHYLRLNSGLAIDLFTADITIAEIDTFPMPGETDGIPSKHLLDRTITEVCKDLSDSCFVVLDHRIYLLDANHGFHKNPLHAGILFYEYESKELAAIRDYWTSKPIELPGPTLSEQFIGLQARMRNRNGFKHLFLDG